MKIRMLAYCLLASVGTVFAATSPSPISGADTGLPGNTAPKPIILSPSMTTSQQQANTASAPTKAKVKHHYKKKPKKIIVSNDVNSGLIGKTFDFQYIGELQGALYALKQYDPKLSVLDPLGKKKAIDINVDVTHISVNDLVDILTQQAKGDARIIYNPVEDSIRLIYDTSMEVGISALQESKRWQEGKAPRPVLGADGMVIYPYGVYQPTVICQPLMLCDIVLQPGEKIINKPFLGDTLNWKLTTSPSGEGSSSVQHIILKPTDPGWETSLLVNTNKRTYMIKLRSSNQGYVSRVGFFYPEDSMPADQSNSSNSSVIDKQQSNSQTSVPVDGAVSPDNFDFNYEISGDDVSWKPVRVFSDGHHVYIQMPDGYTTKNIPLLVVEQNGVKEQVDFSINNNIYTTDFLFDKAYLIDGLDDNQKSITIKHKTPKKHWWS